MSSVELSPTIIMGAPMMVGNRPTTYLKDRNTGHYFRLSALEHSVIESVGRGDSQHAIAATTSARLGRTVPEAAVGRLFGNLLSRGILRPKESGHRIEAAPASAQKAPPRVRIKGPFEVYLRFGRVARLTEWVAGVLRPVPDTLLAWFALVGAVLACEVLWVHGDLALHALQQLVCGPFTAESALFLCMIIIACLLHELSHAVACARYGGEPGDIGVMFRYCSFAFYCRIDDLVVMQSRRARLTTILAGPVSHIFVASPFVLFCIVSHAGGMKYDFSLAFVAVNMGLALLNLLPFVELDGYLLVSIGWKYPELRQEAQLALRRYLPQRGAAPKEKAQPLLALYGAISLLCSVVVCAAALSAWLELCLHAPMVYGTPAVLTFGGVLLRLCRRAVFSKGSMRPAPPASQMG